MRPVLSWVAHAGSPFWFSLYFLLVRNIVTLLGAAQAQKSPLRNQGAVGQVWFGLVWLVLGFDQAKALCFLENVEEHTWQVAYGVAVAIR